MTTIYEQSELNYLEQDIQYILDKYKKCENENTIPKELMNTSYLIMQRNNIQ